MTQRSKPERASVEHRTRVLSADAIAQKVNGFDPKKSIVHDETAQTVLSQWLDLDGNG
jgi:hypothetical protein